MKNNIYTSGGDIVRVFYVRESDLLRALKRHNTGFEVLFHKPTRSNALRFYFYGGVKKGELRTRILEKLYEGKFEGMKNKELEQLIRELSKWMPKPEPLKRLKMAEECLKRAIKEVKHVRNCTYQYCLQMSLFCKEMQNTTENQELKENFEKFANLFKKLSNLYKQERGKE
ncbi:MAG: hypothetical protein ACTSYD_02540 [Candidatus Heimdallarchaeaceae archaeon]